MIHKNDAMRRRNNLGFTLIEMMIVIAIASIMLFGVFYMVNKVQAKRVASEASSTLNTMVADVRAKYAAQGNFTGVTPQVLIENNVPPKNMVSGTNIVSGWNTNVDVAPATLYNANDAISFTYTLPATDCSDFVSAAEASFAKVTVGGAAVKDVTAGKNTLDVSTLGAQCKAQGGSTTTAVFIQGR